MLQPYNEDLNKINIMRSKFDIPILDLSKSKFDDKSVEYSAWAVKIRNALYHYNLADFINKPLDEIKNEFLKRDEYSILREYDIDFTKRQFNANGMK
jgi:hypothetical protein